MSSLRSVKSRTGLEMRQPVQPDYASQPAYSIEYYLVVWLAQQARLNTTRLLARLYLYITGQCNVTKLNALHHTLLSKRLRLLQTNACCCLPFLYAPDLNKLPTGLKQVYPTSH